RLVTPGWASDSWVKWVETIRVLDSEFEGFWMAKGYRRPERPVAPGTMVDPSRMRPVSSLNIKSVIATPGNGASVRSGTPVTISGAAWSGDAGPVESVEVSVDSGRSWRPAKLTGEATRYGWRLWQSRWTPAAEGYYNVLARARDTAGNTQPLVEEWNPSGYQWNVVHRIGVRAMRELSPSPPAPEAETRETAGDYPPGYRASCLACHGEDMIRQQRLTRAQWGREVDKMIGWGSPLTPGDRDGVLQYLSSHFAQGGR
ncbi:MAG: Ig-like domain-containing protein, partial [Streptosporangiaceae bacterium]